MISLATNGKEIIAYIIKFSSNVFLDICEMVYYKQELGTKSIPIP
jgi:hypothetical protein